jgi:hypothetical protein
MPKFLVCACGREMRVIERSGYEEGNFSDEDYAHLLTHKGEEVDIIERVDAGTLDLSEHWVSVKSGDVLNLFRVPNG